MGKISGGRIILEEDHLVPISGWAILVHGKTRVDLFFASEDAAETRQLLDPSLAHCEIVPVKVVGSIVTRSDKK